MSDDQAMKLCMEMVVLMVICGVVATFTGWKVAIGGAIGFFGAAIFICFAGLCGAWRD